MRPEPTVVYWQKLDNHPIPWLHCWSIRVVGCFSLRFSVQLFTLPLLASHSTDSIISKNIMSTIAYQNIQTKFWFCAPEFLYWNFVCVCGICFSYFSLSFSFPFTYETSHKRNLPFPAWKDSKRLYLSAENLVFAGTLTVRVLSTMTTMESGRLLRWRGVIGHLPHLVV